MARTRISKVLAGLGLVAIFALLAGCGGSSDSSTSSSDTFTADANGICKDVNTKSAAIPQPTKASEVESYLTKEGSVTSDGISQLKALTPPADKKDSFNAWLTAIEAQQATIDKATTAAKTDPNQAITILKGTQAASAASNKLAAAIPLTECAKNGNSGGSSGGSSS